MIKKYLIAAAVVAATSMSSATIAAGNFKKVDDAVEYRQKAFSLVRHNFGQMRAMASGKKPFDKQEFIMRADSMAALAKMPWEGFVANSDMKTLGNQTSALPSIWKNKAEFDKLAKKFEENAAYLAKVAQSGDKKAIGKALGKLGKEGCKACHDDYKD